jgi:hypothetical protein
MRRAKSCRHYWLTAALMVAVAPTPSRAADLKLERLGSDELRAPGKIVSMLYCAGEKLVAATQGGVVCAWEGESGKRLWATPPKSATKLCLTTNNGSVLAIDAAGQLLAFDVNSGHATEWKAPKSLPGRVLALSPRGEWAVVKQQGTLRLVDLAGDKSIALASAIGDSGEVAAFSDDSQHVAVVETRGRKPRARVRIWTTVGSGSR